MGSSKKKGKPAQIPPAFSQDFPIVGIGGSAGGLDAFKKFLKAIPEFTGMAYVFVQHLNPLHDSLLPEILSRVTNIPVFEITDKINLAPDTIYIIPENKLLTAVDGMLKLAPRNKKSANLAIDVFFTSLAEVHQSFAVGVVLSGTGADGTLGLKAIKEHGGISFAQNRESASYPDMPQSAINAGLADFILPPEKMPAQLVQIKNNYIIPAHPVNQEDLTKEEEVSFRQILSLLRQRNGVDFSYYKRPTIRRRIARRIGLSKSGNLTNYLNVLRNDLSEQDALFNDVLISVTSFFRDPTIFKAISNHVLPVLFKNRPVNEPIRIWVAACSTGEEAFSIGICLHEFLGEKFSEWQIQIFATDVSDHAIAKARTGIYQKEDVLSLSQERLHKYFTKTNGIYQVNKDIRDKCVFATHNFLKDPPFARLDLISCRNVLIYMDSFLQKKALTTFHYALKENKFLLLGKSETASIVSDLFSPLAKIEKIYSRKSAPGRPPIPEKENKKKNEQKKLEPAFIPEILTTDFRKSAESILLSKYTPAAVIVNEQLDIVHIHGAVAPFLEPSPGKPTFNLLKMAREGLGFELRNALHKAKENKSTFIKEGIPIKNNGNHVTVTIEIIPLNNTADPHFLVLFREIAVPVIVTTDKTGTGISPSEIRLKEALQRNQELEREMAQAREDMRSITEDQEASYEELQSANEELLSGSEELQSLNEELETSKEELQSTNEELIIVNQELLDRQEQLHAERVYSESIVNTIRGPLLVLDKALRIKFANPAFYKQFTVTEQETAGKLMYELQNHQWDNSLLRVLLEKILPEKTHLDDFQIILPFPPFGERTMLLNARQIINPTSNAPLILLAIEDITDRKTAEIDLESAIKELNQKNIKIEKQAEALIKERLVLHNFFMQAPVILCILKGPQHVYELINPAYSHYVGQRDILNKPVREALPELEGQGFYELLDKVYQSGESYTGKEISTYIDRGSGVPEQCYTNFTYQAYTNSDSQIEGILVYAYDVTEQVRARKTIEQNAIMVQNLYMNAPAFVCTLAGPLHIYELVNPAYQKLFGKRRILGKPIMDALPELEGQGFDILLDKVYQTGEPFVGIEVLIVLSPDENMAPENRYFNFSYQPIYNEGNEINGILVFGYEVTNEIRGRKVQEESTRHFRFIAEAMPQKVWTADSMGNLDYFNNRWLEYTHKSFEELKGWGWTEIIHPDDRNIIKESWKLSIDTGEDFQVEHRLLRQDGNYRWHLCRGLPQKDEGGKLLMWVGTNTDIHEQKVKEQTKDEFISIASHEMKTPLTIAKAYLQLLEQTVDKNDGNASLYTKKASESINRLNDLITELLDVSKIQFGKLNYTFSTFNFNDLLDNTIKNIQYSTPAHTLIKTGLATRLITGDKDRLDQVVINLLTNAIKYSPKGGNVYINVKENENEIEVSIKDNGLGISPQNLEKIFDKYYRVEDHANQSQGLGIGLFISFEIIQRHQGKVWAESNPGSGSTFYFTLPISKAL